MRTKYLLTLIGAGLLMVCGCASLPPYDLKPTVPVLAVTSKRPLKIAAVVSDPMSYTQFYQGAGSYRRDWTADARSGGFMLERELSKLVADTFSQLFTQVIVVRELPQPGQYDAVIIVEIGQILFKEKVVLTGETCDLTAEWKLTVLDYQNREFLSKQGVSPAHNFKWSVFTPSRDIILGTNEKMSLILSELAREWGNMLYALELPTPSGAKK